jgi:hypothetical protein
MRTYKMRCLTSHTGVVGPRKITNLWAFDFDDTGTQVSQLARTERRRNGVFKGYDGHAV